MWDILYFCFFFQTYCLFFLVFNWVVFKVGIFIIFLSYSAARGKDARKKRSYPRSADGSASGSSGLLKCRGVFRNCRGFVTTCFHFKVGTGFTFEMEIIAIIYALELAQTRDLDFIWLVSNSCTWWSCCGIVWLRFLGGWKLVGVVFWIILIGLILESHIFLGN